MEALRRAVLPLAIVSSLAYVVLAVHAFNQQFFDLDHAAAALARSARHPFLQIVMRALSDLASGYALLPLSAVMYIFMRHRGHHAAKFIPWMVVGAYAVFTLSKWIVARPRPRLSPYGFPSAHAFGAVVFFGGLIYLLWTSDIGRVWRWTGTALLVLLVVGVGVSRIYLRAHWLSDVLGGVMGGAAYLLFFLLAAEPSLRPSRSRG
jgi:membrane-associated phospholipid phosphatase